MQVGHYQISNVLIGPVLLTTVAGLGIDTAAAASVAGAVSDTFIPGGNATQAPDTDSDSSETDQNTDATDSQDSDDGGGSSDSTDSTGSTDSSDSGSSDSDDSSTDSTSTQDSGTEDQEPPGYYDKAVNDDTDTEDGSSESDQELNFSEKTDLESEFEGHVKNTKRDNGVYLDRKAAAGERDSIQVYYEGNSVSGTEIILNGDSIGETGKFGSLLFTVPGRSPGYLNYNRKSWNCRGSL